MKQATEPVAPTDLGHPSTPYHRDLGERFRLGQCQGPVRAMPVVVLDVHPQHPLQMPTSEDQQPIKALLADGWHLTLSVGVCVGRLDRCAEDRDALRTEDVVERASELGVSVSEQEA